MKCFQQTGLTSTPSLGTLYQPIQTVTDIAFLIPFASVWVLCSLQPTRSSRDNHFLAAQPSSSRRAGALVTVYFIYTSGTVATRGRLAFIDVNPAIRSCKTRGAFTAKPVDTINTNSTIIAVERDKIRILYFTIL